MEFNCTSIWLADAGRSSHKPETSILEPSARKIRSRAVKVTLPEGATMLPPCSTRLKGFVPLSVCTPFTITSGWLNTNCGSAVSADSAMGDAITLPAPVVTLSRAARMTTPPFLKAVTERISPSFCTAAPYIPILPPPSVTSLPPSALYVCPSTERSV